MLTRPIIILIILFSLTLWIGSSPAQLQQSGGPGSTVTVGAALPAGTNVIGHVIADSGSTTAVTGTVSSSQSGTWTVQPGNTANTTAWKVDNSGVTQPVSGTVSVTALPTGANVIGSVVSIPKTACGNTVASQALAAVPTSSTAVFSSTTCIVAIILNNTNGSSATVTVTDNAGTPINDVLTFSIPANSQLIQPLFGVAFTTGMKWSASGTGVTGAALGYQ
jgi:hypothetical protein